MVPRHRGALGSPDGVIIKGLRRDGLATGRVSWCVRTLPSDAGTPATEGIEDHRQHNRAGSTRLGRHHLINGVNQADLVRIGFHNGQMLDLEGLDGRWDRVHTTLLRQRGVTYLLACDDDISWLGLAVRAKRAGKIRGSPSEGVRRDEHIQSGQEFAGQDRLKWSEAKRKEPKGSLEPSKFCLLHHEKAGDGFQQ